MTTIIRNINEHKRNVLIISFLFYMFFLFLTSLGPFNKEVSSLHRGPYSVIGYDYVADDNGHIVYLISLFFDQDIDFLNEQFNSMMKLSQITGYLQNPWPIGASVLWFPFFTIGHLITITLNILGYDIIPDGYSFPYISMIAIGSIFYGFLGNLFCYKSLCFFLKPRSALLATIATFFSSILTYYVYIRPFMDMSLDFFNLSLFVYLFALYAINTPSSKLFYLSFGIVCGIMSITRFNGIIYTVGFFIYLIYETFDKLKRKEKIEWILKFRQLCFIASGFFVTILPQLITNSILNGSFLNPGPALGANLSTFKTETLINIFIGRIGIFYQSPIYIIGFLGFIMFLFGRHKRDTTFNRFYISLFLSFLCQIVLTASLSTFGNEYGIKFLSSSIVFIMFGVAFLLNYLLEKKLTKYFVFIAILLIGWQYIQLIQYKIIFDDYNFSVFKVLPTLFFIIKNHISLLLRSSNTIALLFYGYFHIDSAIDAYFFLFIPAILVILILTILIWENVISGFMKNKLAILTVLVFFITLSFLLASQPQKTQKEIDERLIIYSRLGTFERTVLLDAEVKLFNYRLGILKRDKKYSDLIKLKYMVLNFGELYTSPLKEMTSNKKP